MIKAERQAKICEMLEKNGTISVREISGELGVSDMTIRRDLEELAAMGSLERVHGGARKLAQRHMTAHTLREYSHREKRKRNPEAKAEIARTAIGLIGDNETVFLGTGTTIERMVAMLPPRNLRIVTNSLSVFNLLENRDDYELCLVGGLYRRRTAAFVGPMAEDAVASLGIDVAFVGANGIAGDDVSTSNMEEGKFQQLVLNKATRRYLVADTSKLDRRDFYAFYRLQDVTALVCERSISDEQRAVVKEFTRIITA